MALAPVARIRTVALAFAVALVPKCTLCLGTHAVVLASLGAGVVWMRVVAGLGLAAVLALLAHGARGRRGYGPLALAAVAAAWVAQDLFHTHGHHGASSPLHTVAAVCSGLMLVGASLWNAWPRAEALHACASGAAQTG
ncbi:MAG TPA: hypothetical protein VF705_08385 [Longimicrobium sp.]